MFGVKRATSEGLSDCDDTGTVLDVNIATYHLIVLLPVQHSVQHWQHCGKGCVQIRPTVFRW